MDAEHVPVVGREAQDPVARAMRDAHAHRVRLLPQAAPLLELLAPERCDDVDEEREIGRVREGPPLQPRAVVQEHHAERRLQPREGAPREEHPLPEAAGAAAGRARVRRREEEVQMLESGGVLRQRAEPLVREAEEVSRRLEVVEVPGITGITGLLKLIVITGINYC